MKNDDNQTLFQSKCIFYIAILDSIIRLFIKFEDNRYHDDSDVQMWNEYAIKVVSKNIFIWFPLEIREIFWISK